MLITRGPLLISKDEHFLETFALSVANHYMHCSTWRSLLKDFFSREKDAYVFRGKDQDYGFSFCPHCGKQVCLLKTPPARLT